MRVVLKYKGDATMNRLILCTLLFLVKLMAPFPIQAQPIVKHPDPAGTVEARWNWAQAEAARRGVDQGYWIGYSIRRLMGKYSTTGTWNSDWRDETSLYEMIYGERAPYEYQDRFNGRERSDEERVRRAAKRALEELTLKREAIGEDTLEARVRFTLFLGRR